MIPNEVDKAIEVIRAYCKEAECLKCEYISKEKVKGFVRSGISTDTEADKEYVCSFIDSIPSADVRENIHALWEINDRGIWCCPKCKTEVYDGDSDQYCRKCGLDFKYTAHIQKMIKGEDDREGGE